MSRSAEPNRLLTSVGHGVSERQGAAEPASGFECLLSKRDLRSVEVAIPDPSDFRRQRGADAIQQLVRGTPQTRGAVGASGGSQETSEHFEIPRDPTRILERFAYRHCLFSIG